MLADWRGFNRKIELEQKLKLIVDKHGYNVNGLSEDMKDALITYDKLPQHMKDLLKTYELHGETKEDM